MEDNMKADYAIIRYGKDGLDVTISNGERANIYPLSETLLENAELKIENGQLHISGDEVIFVHTDLQDIKWDKVDKQDRVIKQKKFLWKTWQKKTFRGAWVRLLNRKPCRKLTNNYIINDDRG